MIDDKSYIIDPLTTLCKLALLNFMSVGTKLSISHHILHIQEYSYIQGAMRTIHGDNRRDISYINIPLLKVIKWYILDSEHKISFSDDKMEQSIKIITNYAIKGLKKAQSTTYADDISMKIILQYFINMLVSALNNNLTEDSVVKNPTEGTILTDTIKNNYDPHTINTIAKMLTDADQTNNLQSNINILIECIHKLLINRDIEFANLMKEINTNI